MSFVLLALTVSSGLSQSASGGPAVEAFFNAIRNNDTNTVVKMLDNDTNLVRAFYYGRLPLHVAAAKGSVEIVRQLLKHGADINARGDTLEISNGRLTALSAAVWNNHPEVCRFLLQAGADPNIQSPFGGGALHYVIAYGRTEMAGLLLDHGADPFLKKATFPDSTPFELDITQGDGKLALRFLAESDKHFSRLKSKTAPPPGTYQEPVPRSLAEFLANRGPVLLTAAVQRGELEALQALIKAGVPVRDNDAQREPLMQKFALSETTAAKAAGFDPNRWAQIQSLLIKHGADYDAFAATALGDLAKVRELVSANKNVVQAADRNGQTPLHWSVQSDQLPMTSFWLQAGVSPGATNSAGQTALHLAAAKGLVEHMKLLLAAHAPTDSRDTNGWTPMDAAIHANQADSIRVLLSENTATSRPDRAIATTLHKAAAEGNLALLSALTEGATNLEARDELGFTPLQLAVLRGHLAAAALLVDKGADLNVRDTEGNTMLHQILLQGRQLIVYDRPPTSWFERMGSNPRKETYLNYLRVGQYEQGPNPVLQAASFLLACGLDARATNHAGQTVVQLATDDTVAERSMVFDDDRAKLLKLLGTGGGDVNEADANGDTALHRAARDLVADRVASLIASGADINATNHQGRTPLHQSVEHIGAWDNGDGSNEPFQLLLKSKPNVNAQDLDGLTPLHILALSDTSFKKEATKALLEAGANPDMRDKHGRSPVHLFLTGKWPWSEADACITLLVKAGADLSAEDDEGKTPLHYFAALGSQNPMFFVRNMSNMLVAAKVDFRARDNKGDTPLHIAARSGTRDVFDWLMKQGANLDETNYSGDTPRILAARSTDPLSRFNSSPDTDIFQAARDGRTDAVSLLLKADPNLLNQTNQIGQTPIRVAAMFHRTNMVAFLDQNGAEWDPYSAVLAERADKLRGILSADPTMAASTLYGASLLHTSAAEGNVEITKMLLENHADPGMQDSRGLSPLGYALLRNRTEAAALLRQHGAAENIFDAVYCDDSAAAEKLLSGDKSLAKATNVAGMSLVEIAAGTDRANILKLLLDKGASAGLANERDGWTPLHAAALYNYTNTAAMLLRQGAKVEVMDKSGFTPLHLAAAHGSVEVAALLLKHKADPNAPMPLMARSGMPQSLLMRQVRALAGCTALHLAAMEGQTNVIALLLKSSAEINATNSTGSTALDLVSPPGLTMDIMQMLPVSARMLNPTPGETRQTFSLVLERRKVAADMLEKSGGKRLYRANRNF